MPGLGKREGFRVAIEPVRFCNPSVPGALGIGLDLIRSVLDAFGLFTWLAGLFSGGIFVFPFKTKGGQVTPPALCVRLEFLSPRLHSQVLPLVVVNVATDTSAVVVMLEPTAEMTFADTWSTITCVAPSRKR